MPSTYVVGYDGSDAARAALRFTTQLAGRTGAEVIAANVYLRPAHVLGKGNDDGALAALEADVRAEAEHTLREGVPDVLRCAVGGTSAAEGLHRFADQQRAELVAVGTTHRGAAGRLLSGSVGEHLLHGAPCPVLVVPPDAGDATIARIGVAYDTREESRAALRVAERLAHELDAKLVVLAVHEPVLMAYAAPGVAAGTVDLDQRLEREFREAVERQVPGGSGTEVRVLSGSSPSHVLTDAAKDGVDLLVAGSRGYGAIRGVLAGSVSRHLVDHAPCPVLVTPRGVEVKAFEGTASTASAGA